MQLKFSFEDGGFNVSTHSGAGLRALPPKRRGEPTPPVHRFQSLAIAGHYTAPSAADTEDDILHMWELPDFGALDLANVRALGQHDSELLLSYLTVPYLRIPLVASYHFSPLFAINLGFLGTDWDTFKGQWDMVGQARFRFGKIGHIGPRQ